MTGRTVQPITLPYKPHRLTALDVAIGTTVLHLMPPWHDIPLVYRIGSRPGAEQTAADRWRALVVAWLTGDGNEIQLRPLEGIDHDVARRHIAVVLGNPSINTAHKVGAASYLCSLWFDDAVIEVAS